MAGLGRIQQRFNLAVLTPIALLLGWAGRQQGLDESQPIVSGHPILAKYTKSSNPNRNTRGSEYPGYCAGQREAARRVRQGLTR